MEESHYCVLLHKELGDNGVHTGQHVLVGEQWFPWAAYLYCEVITFSVVRRQCEVSGVRGLYQL